MPQAGRVRIDVLVAPDGGASLAVDGRPLTRRSPLSWVHGIGRPHPLVWLRHERQYDVELWFADELVGYVPRRSPDTEAAYEAAERLSA